MIDNNGQFKCKQSARMKPTKYGVKLWLLRDSTNAYTWNLSVYHGQDGERFSANGLSYDVVMPMIEGLQKEVYIVYTDNFYSITHF